MTYSPVEIAAKFDAKARTLTSEQLLTVVREFIRIEAYNELFDIACGILIDRNAGYGAQIESLMDV